MIDLLFRNPVEFFLTSLLLVIAISVHEFAHAWAADRLGDPTPRLAGRLTLSPQAHLDPFGTLLILFIGFGWGKPVPFDPFNLKRPKRDAALISAAGPISNALMALFGSILLRWMIATPLITFSQVWGSLVTNFIYFNVVLGVFNLTPIHPLDGFKIVAGIIPKKYYADWIALERYGILFLIILVLPIFGSPPIHAIIYPIINTLLSFLIPVSGGGII